MNKLFIDKLVIIFIKDHKILVTQGKGQDNWQIPTTEVQELETDVEALNRLVNTHLHAEILEGTIRHFGNFETHAHAHGTNPEKTDKAAVKLKCYIAELGGEFQPGDTVQKIDFFWYNQKHLLLHAYFGIVDELKNKGLLA